MKQALRNSGTDQTRGFINKTIEVGVSLPSSTDEEEDYKIRDLPKTVKHVVDFSNL